MEYDFELVECGQATYDLSITIGCHQGSVPRPFLFAARGMHQSKPGLEQQKPVGPKDRVFEYAKTGDWTGFIRSGPGLTHLPPSPVRVRPEASFNTKNKLENGRF